MLTLEEKEEIINLKGNEKEFFKYVKKRFPDLHIGHALEACKLKHIDTNDFIAVFTEFSEENKKNHFTKTQKDFFNRMDNHELHKKIRNLYPNINIGYFLELFRMYGIDINNKAEVYYKFKNMSKKDPFRLNDMTKDQFFSFLKKHFPKLDIGVAIEECKLKRIDPRNNLAVYNQIKMEDERKRKYADKFKG